MRPRLDQKKLPKTGCLVTVQSLFKYISKLLDASDVSDKAASQLYLFSERRLIEYADACRSFQRQLSNLHDQKEAALLALEHERARSQRLGEEAKRLQCHLDIIRQVLRDSDLDQAKQRLAQLEWDLSDWPPFSPGDRRREHSAGSLLDPGNASSSSDTGDKNTPHVHPHPARKSATVSRRKSRAVDNPETLRRSTRLSSNRQSVSFLNDKSGHRGRTESRYQSTSTMPADRGVPRKRASSESNDSYHDVLLKPSPLVGCPLLSDDDGLIPGAVGGATTDDSTSLVSMNAFEATPTASATGSFVKSGSKKRKRLDTPVTGSRLTRPHNFASRSVLHFETCSCCGKKVTFGKQALKCNNCRLVVHAVCRNQLKQPCVPVSELSPSPRPDTAGTTPMMKSQSRGAFQLVQTPLRQTPLHDRRHNAVTTPLSSATKRQTIRRTLKLSNCCPPNEFPQVPAIVIHCVTEVATRGLQQVGIYRISGAAKQVQELYSKFMHGRVTPSLALVEDINVICSCLKMFLSALDEPLVTYALRPQFAEVAKLAESEPEVFKFRVAMILDRLPPVYRDTLSFLMLHLKTVSRSAACRMGEENLARVFGPTIVGYSSPDPTPMQVASEIPTQQSVVRLLFSVPDSVFSTVLNSLTGSARSSCQSVKSGNTYFQPLHTSATAGSHGDGSIPETLIPSSTTATRNDVTTQGRFFERLFSRNRD
ncbi:Rac GTPase-activating protein 1 [Sparganum proliferum]